MEGMGRKSGKRNQGTFTQDQGTRRKLMEQTVASRGNMIRS